MTPAELGRQVYARRKQLRIPAQDVARAAGISRATLWRLENGRTNPLVSHTVMPVLDVLGMSLVVRHGDVTIPLEALL